MFGVILKFLYFVSCFLLGVYIRKNFNRIVDFYKFGKVQGFWFAFKYKTGIAKQGKDFE